jgi:hypothetical protein
LFKREVAVSIGEPSIKTFAAGKPVFQVPAAVRTAASILGLEGGVDAVNAAIPRGSRTLLSVTDATIIIRDLRVTFEVEKHLGSEPNTCTIKVYNLAEPTRALLQRKPISVRLDAGYDGELAQLFTGDLRWGTSSLDSVDWITSLQVGDGDRAHRFARCSRSFAAGVSVASTVKDVVASMGLKLPAGVEAKLRTQYATGVTVHGNSARELTRLLKPLGLSWSIQDGRLQVLASGDVRSDAPIEVSQDTGLIGTVEYGAPVEGGESADGRERKAKPPMLKFKMLLYPGLTPGGQVRVKSRSINGLFRVERVVHSGDTHGSDWFSEVEARQVT